MNLRRWLTPGIGIKRWLLVVFAGLLLLAVAFAHFLRQITRDYEPTGLAGGLIDLLTLQFLPFALRGFVAGSVGVVLVLFGAWRTVHVLTDPLRAPDPDQPLVELIYQKRFLARGPRIVAIGGGTGLSTLLRGLKEHTSNLTAIVTVADDGGSSGVLREELGIPPGRRHPQLHRRARRRGTADERGPPVPVPGDRRARRTAWPGHALGNLLIAAMTAVEGGDFEDGIRLMNRILAVRGRVLPVSPTPITLHARTTDGTVVDGQSHVMRTTEHRARLDQPRGRRSIRGRAGRDRRGRAHRPRAGQPVHEPPPEPADPGHPRRGPGRRGTADLRLQRGDPGGRDDRLRPRRARRGARRAHEPEPDRHRPRQQPPGPSPGRGRDRTAIDDAEAPRPVRLRWPPSVTPVPRLILDEVIDADNAHHHDPARLATAVLSALEGEVGIRRRNAGRTTSRTA